MMRMTPGIAVKAGLVLSHSIGIAMRHRAVAAIAIAVGLWLFGVWQGV